MTGVFFFITLSAAAVNAAKSPRISAVRVQESYTLPAVEISGLAWRKNPETKKRELIFVSDRSYKLYVLDWETRKSNFTVREIDLAPTQKNTPPQSQWESVFSDDSGRVFIIKEQPGEILVLSPDLSKTERVIHLSVPEMGGNANSGGEGLVPLKNGHILVVKEKNPLHIIEFSAYANPAEGYKPSLSIEKVGLFPLPAETSEAITLSTSFIWRFEPELEDLFEDASELVTGPQGELYLLGDQKNLIGRLGGTLKLKKDRIKLKQLFSLPSSIKKPEGMVLDDDARPVVAIDSKRSDQPNVFVLSPLK